MPIDAREAQRIISEDIRRQNTAVLPPTLARIRRMQAEETFPICNVGPWDYRIERASLIVFIPGYNPSADPEKKGYSESTAMPEIRREAKLIGGGGESPLEYSYIEDDGREVARDVIGIGFGLAKHAALDQYGVFIPVGKKPKKEEIAAANQRLDNYADQLIHEARDAFDKGREEWGKVRSDRHFWAARRRGVFEKWVDENTTQQSVPCDMCGSWNPSGVAKCKGCGAIIDADLYLKLQTRQEEIMAATKPKK